MIQTIILTLIVCGSLISVAKRYESEELVGYLSATFITVPLLEGKGILERDSFDFSSSSVMGQDDFPQTMCKDYRLVVLREILTKSTHPP